MEKTRLIAEIKVYAETKKHGLKIEDELFKELDKIGRRLNIEFSISTLTKFVNTF